MLKKIALYVLGAALCFNAGFDATRAYRAYKVGKFVAGELSGLEGVTSLKVQNCVDVKGHFWLCEIEIATADGNNGKQLVPVPYEVLK